MSSLETFSGFLNRMPGKVLRVHALVLLACVFSAALSQAQQDAPDAAADQQRQIAEWQEFLKSPEAERRSFGATSLLHNGDPAALTALREALRSGSGETRVSVLRAIAIPGDQRFLPDVLAALDSDSERVRESAFEALKSMRGAAPIEEMAAYALRPDATLIARTRVCEALADMSALSAVPALIELLDNEDARLARAAHQALRRITVLDLPTDPQAWGAWWQANEGKPRAEKLADIVRRQDERIRSLEARVEALLIERFAARPPNQNGQAVGEALKSEYAGVRRLAIQAAVKDNLTALIPELMSMLKDPKAGVRAEAAKALADLGARDAVPLLIEALSDPAVEAQAAAARALGGLRAAEAVEELTKSLSKPPVARAAAEALGRIGDPRAVAKLSDLLVRQDSRTETRCAAASALGQLGDRAATGALLRAAAEEEVRWFAIDAIGSLGAAAGDEPLVEAVDSLAQYLLADPKPDVREAAAVAFGKIGAPQALNGLTQALDDAEPRVREQAARAFERIAGQDIELYRVHIARLHEDERFQRAARLGALAAERFAKSDPEAAGAFRRQRASCLRLARDWTAARTAYAALLNDTPGDAALYEEGAEVLEALGGNERALLALHTQARKAVPQQEAKWWEASASVVERMVARGEYIGAAAAVDAMEADEPALGKTEASEKLVELREAARSALRDGDAETAEERVKAVVGRLAENNGDREILVTLLASVIGQKAVEPLVEHALAHEDETVRLAAVDALQKITSRDFGLNNDPSAEERDAAIERWIVEWRKAQGGEAQPDGGGADEDGEANDGGEQREAD